MNLADDLTHSLKEHLDGKPLNVGDGTAVIWEVFTALSQTRPRTGMGISPITFGEVQAYSQLMNVPLQPRHVDAIMAMDRAYMEHISKPPAPEAMTAYAFDNLSVRVGGA